jgi:hypothetical protein
MKNGVIVVPMLVIGLALAQSVTEQMATWAVSGKTTTRKPATADSSDLEHKSALLLTNDSIVKFIGVVKGRVGEDTIIEAKPG